MKGAKGHIDLIQEKSITPAFGSPCISIIGVHDTSYHHHEDMMVSLCTKTQMHIILLQDWDDIYFCGDKILVISQQVDNLLKQIRD